MRVLLIGIAGVALAVVPAHAQRASPVSPSTTGKTCAGESQKECDAPKEDPAKARQAFERGLRLKDTNPQEAFDAFSLAVQLAPGEAGYVTTRELFRQQLAYEHIQRGNQLLSRGDAVGAAGEFRQALQLDAKNQFASERLLDATHTPPPARPLYREPESDSPDTGVHPRPGEQDLHLTSTTRAAYSTVAGAFGIKVDFDSSTPDSRVEIDLKHASFEQAMNTVALVSRSFWTPVSASQVLVAADSPAKRNELERSMMRTFYLPETSSPQGLAEMGALLRTLFEIRSVTESFSNSTITVRGPAPKIVAATQFLESLPAQRPEVMLDFQVYQITRQTLRDLGISLPSQFTMFNIPHSSLSGSSGLQQVMGRGMAAGSLSPEVATALPALISKAQQDPFNSLLPPSVATFGGGQSRIGVQVPPAVASFAENGSRAISLSDVSMRGSQGKPTTFRLGTRYPVITSVYTGGTSLASLPALNYEDLGITIKATPAIHKNDVTLDLDLTIDSLGSQLFNGIPTINNRSYSGAMTVGNDQPAVVASSLSRTELNSMQGIPGIRHLPLLASVTSSRHTEDDEDELLIMITPHIITAPPMDEGGALVMPRN